MVPVAQVELRGLPRPVAQGPQNGLRRLGEPLAGFGRTPQGDEAPTEGEPTVGVSSQQVVRFEGHCEAMRGVTAVSSASECAPSWTASITSTDLSRTPTPLTMCSTSRDYRLK